MAEKKLIREYYALCPDNICNISLLTEEEIKLKNNGKMLLSGILQRANQKNGNGRVYSREILAREDQKYQELIKENRALGECDHPDTEVVNLRNASHVVRRTFWDGDELWGVIQVLSTPAGKILEALVRDGIQVGISSRGLGSLTEANGGSYVNDDFVLVAYDICSVPSTQNAFMHLKEAKRLEERQIKDKIQGILSEILKKK